MDYTKKALRGASFILIMGALTSVFAYVVRMIIARNLSPAEYGLFYSMLTFILFFSVFRDMGLHQAMTKYIAEYNIHKDYSKIKTFIVSSLLFQFIFSCLIFLILFSLSGFLAEHYFKTSLALGLFRFLIFYIFASMLIIWVLSILAGFQSMGWFSLIEPIKNIIIFVLALLFFYLDFNIFTPAIAYIFASVITAIIMIIPLSKYIFIFKCKIDDFWGTTAQLFRFGIPVIFTGVGHMIIAYIDVLLLTYFVALDSVGIYNVILPTAVMFLFLGRSISTILFPMISELWAKKDKVRVSEGINLIYNYSFALTLPLIFAIFIFADLFIGLLFGLEYVSGILAFRILLIGVLGYMIAEINHSALSGIGKPKIVTKIISIIAVINLVLNLILIPHFKLTGAAIATTVSYIVAFFMSTNNIVKIIGIPPPWKRWIKILLSGMVFIGVTYFMKFILSLNVFVEAAISLTIAGSVYILLCFLLRIINIQDIKIVKIKRLI